MELANENINGRIRPLMPTSKTPMKNATALQDVAFFIGVST